MRKKLLFALVTVLIVTVCVISLVACDGPKDPQTHSHTMVHHEEQVPDCFNDGNVEYWTCQECGKYFLDPSGEKEVADKTELTLPASHLLNYIPERQATCTEDGNIAYWQCEKCKKLFQDEQAQMEITDPQSVVVKGAHVLKHFAEKPATCTEGGNMEYWQCENCFIMFSDETATVQIDTADTPANGHNTRFVEGRPATCTEQGQCDFYHCDTCGKDFWDEQGTNFVNSEDELVIDPEGHLMSYTPYRAPTCKNTGMFENWYCYKCNNYFADENGDEIIFDIVISALGHDMIYHERREATCTENGIIECYECQRCHKYFEDEKGVLNEWSESFVTIPATHQKAVSVPQVNATCTEDGCRSYWECPACHVKFRDWMGTEVIGDETELIIPKTGHNLKHVAASDPTCTQNGNREYWMCYNCGKYFSDENSSDELVEEELSINATGHNMQHHAAVEVTCTTDGNSEYWFCTNCNKYFRDSKGNSSITEGSWVIYATGHSYDDGKITTPATCTENGEKTFTCRNCGGTRTEVIVATGHSTTFHNKVSPTCTESGVDAYWDCSRCNKLFSDYDCTKEIPEPIVLEAYGHNMTHHAKVEPTCTQDGTEEYWFCNYCIKRFADENGNEQLTDVVIAATGHSFSEEWTYDETYHWHEATCGHTDQIADKSTHITSGGVCDICHCTKPSSGIEYTLSSDGRYYIVTGIGTCTSRDILIAVRYRGLPVLYIGDGAFENVNSVGKIEIPEGVRYIGSNAFKNCSISSIVIPTTIGEIHYDAFLGCSNLDLVVIEDVSAWVSIHFYNKYSNPLHTGAEMYTDFLVKDPVISEGVSTISDFAFYGYTYLERITLPQSLTRIGTSAFEGCTSLKAVYIPDGVQRIDDYAFADCTSLIGATFGSGLSTLGLNVFEGCLAHERITVPESNAVYASQDGIMYNKQMTEFICVPLAIKGNVTIPQTVTEIPNEAFYNRVLLTGVTLPDGLTRIGKYAFNGCELLSEITLPNGLQMIDDYAFANCILLEDFIIPDSVNSIGKYTFRNCNSLTDMTIPEGITELTGTFSNCQSLVKLTLPSTLLVLGSDAIRDCNKLAELHLPDGLTEIGYCSFQNCYALTSLNIPSSVTKIDIMAFGGLDSLTAIHITDMIAWLNMEINSSPLFYAKNLYLNGELVTEVIVPDVIKVIKENAFAYCESLVRVKLPEGLTSIGANAFLKCKNLSDINIPSSVTEIGASAFESCSIENISVPDGVTSIEPYTFRGAMLLKSIIIPVSVVNIGEWAFYCGSGVEVYYKGTSEQWNSITIGEWNSAIKPEFLYFYVENQQDVPADGGNYWHFDEDGVTPVVWSNQ